LVAATTSSVLAREMERTRTTAVANLQSYSLMLGAVGLMHRLSRRDFDEARQYLVALNDRASQQAVPLAWLAHWHILRVQQGWSPDIQRDTLQARVYARQAIEADDQCSLAIAVEGFVRTNLLKDLAGAQESYHRALAANPNEPLASLLLGTCHAFRGEGGPAVAYCEQALELSPLDPHRYFYLSLSATAYLADGQYEAAVTCAEASYRANRAHTSTLRALMVAHWKLGRRDAARRNLAELRRLEPDLTIRGWLERTPSAAYPIGREWAETMAAIGLPD
jgi:tetratricopeptide (TPR) repeat protein